MIQESTVKARIGAQVEGAFADLVKKVTGLVGGTGLYSLIIGDKIVCNESTFQLRERFDDVRKQIIQSPIFRLEDGRVASVGTIARRNADGKFHAQSVGLEEIIGKLQSASEVIVALNGKTLEVVAITEILVPAFGKPGLFDKQKQYAYKVI